MRASPRAAAAGFAALAVVVACQWVLFKGFVAREVAWAYPAHFDQVAALSRSYETHERIRSDGLWAGLVQGAQITGASGTLLPLQAAVFYRLFGASRLSALAVSFFYFALFQAALVATLLWLTGRLELAALGLGLLLCTGSPFLVVGGLADFRMDSATASLMGVFLCLAIRSRAFAEPRWAAAAGLVAAVLVLMRTLTLVYLAGILGIFGLVVAWKCRGAGPDAALWRARRKGLVVAACLMGAVVLPLLALRWQSIHDYYVVGHMTGSMRWVFARLLGLRTTSDFLLFYPVSLLRDHAGARFVALSALALAGAFAAGLRGPRPAPDPDWRAAFAFTGAALAFPMAVLTADVAKSSIVAGVLVPATLWLVLLGVLRLMGPDRRAAAAALGALALVAGAQAQRSGYAGPGPFRGRERDVEEAKRLHEWIGESSRSMGWTAPLVTVDRLLESLVPSVTTTEMYERRGLFLKVRFGAWGIPEVGEREATDSVARSDFVLLSSPESPEGPFPFDASMRKLHAVLERAAARDHVPVRRLTIQGIDVVVHVRAALRIEGVRQGLIPPEGLTLTGLGPVLRSRPELELAGPVESAPPAVPSLSAEARDRGGRAHAVDADLSVSARSYRIRLRVPENGFDPESPLEVHLRPGEAGLRLRAPEEVVLSPRAGPS